MQNSRLELRQLATAAPISRAALGPDESVYWGAEGKWLDDQRRSTQRDFENPLAAVQMGLIYVNPEEETAFRRLDQRLAQLLIQRGPIVHGTHQNLADELGSVREVVSRLLRGFEERGWVELARERVTVVDPKALAAYAHG
jgi:hypothetical protein